MRFSFTLVQQPTFSLMETIGKLPLGMKGSPTSCACWQGSLLHVSSRGGLRQHAGLARSVSDFLHPIIRAGHPRLRLD